MAVFCREYMSPIGRLMLESDATALTGVWFDKSAECNGDRCHILDIAVDWLDRYFSGACPDVNELRLSPYGSDFRKKVWDILCSIPYGETVTYGEIAKMLASESRSGKMSAQAVGGAVGANPISVIIPCHRVIGVGGCLTGYGGGLKRKIKLLEHEGIDVSKFKVPTGKAALNPKTAL